MTQQDAWAAAQTSPQSNAAAAGSAAGASLMPQGGELGGGSLFGGGKRRPGLFNRTHFKGTERTGVIRDIKDVHASFHPNEGGGLKYWPAGQSGKGVKPTGNDVGMDGKPNRPVMDTVFILDTEYRLSPAEVSMLEFDAEAASGDEGERGWVVDIRATQEAIKVYNASAPQPINNPAALIGKRITVRRLMDPGVKGQAWDVKISNA